LLTPLAFHCDITVVLPVASWCCLPVVLASIASPCRKTFSRRFRAGVSGQHLFREAGQP